MNAHLGNGTAPARPPSVGAEEILLFAGDRNLTGHSDPFDIVYGIAEGGNRGDDIGEHHGCPLGRALETTTRVRKERVHKRSAVEGQEERAEVRVTDPARSGKGTQEPGEPGHRQQQASHALRPPRPRDEPAADEEEPDDEV